MKLFDPLTAGVADWPDGSQRLRAYVEAFARQGAAALIANLRTRVLVLRVGKQTFPVTVNDAEYGDTYVCSPHTAYSLYAKEELRLIRNAAARAILGAVSDAAGALLKAARVNRMVQVNNWMLSTNLFPACCDLPFEEMTQLLVTQFPAHFICFRSLNPWTNEATMRQLRRARYKLVASRQVYGYERLAETWGRTSNCREDRRLLARTPYRVVASHEIVDTDFPRMAELYRLLYLEKYPRYNPAFTAEYLRLCHRSGVMRFLGLRASDGILAGILGLFIVDGVITAPIVGYDTAVDRKAGLYRLLMTLIFEHAHQTGERINLSSGAAHFKRLRGGRGIIEYSAVYDRHLSMGRRAVLNTLAAITNGLGVPLMRQLKL